MLQCCKDREPGKSGFRSFFQFKNIAFFAIIICSIIWYSTNLVVAVFPENGKSPIVFTTEKGDQWNVYLTHSVEKTPWEEFFQVNGVNDMTLTSTKFESLGWGFPYGEYEGTLEHKNGRYLLKMNRPFTMVSIRVASQAMQKLVHGKDCYDLVPLYGTGTKVDIYVLYRYQYWLRRLKQL